MIEAAETFKLAEELVALERQVKAARAAVAHNHEPPYGMHAYQVEAKHAAWLQSYARALLREYLQGKPSVNVSLWVIDPDEPLSKRRIEVLGKVLQQFGKWDADKQAGRLLPPVGDAAKYGDQIVDNVA